MDVTEGAGAVEEDKEEGRGAAAMMAEAGAAVAAAVALVLAGTLAAAGVAAGAARQGPGQCCHAAQIQHLGRDEPALTVQHSTDATIGQAWL